MGSFAAEELSLVKLERGQNNERVLLNNWRLASDHMAFVVRGDFMIPRVHSGDVVVVDRAGTSLSGLSGKDAVVCTEDGSYFFRNIKEVGNTGLYDLEAWNAPTVRAVRVQWASLLIAIVLAVMPPESRVFTAETHSIPEAIE